MTMTIVMTMTIAMTRMMMMTSGSPTLLSDVNLMHVSIEVLYFGLYTVTVSCFKLEISSREKYNA